MIIMRNNFSFLFFFSLVTTAILTQSRRVKINDGVRTGSIIMIFFSVLAFGQSFYICLVVLLGLRRCPLSAVH